MAPEQIDDASLVDARADVYSMGVVLFAVLTLERLHPGENAFEVLESTRRGVDARPSVRAPDKGLPPEYDAICSKATAKDPARRYANVRELHDAVARVIDGDRDLRLRIELSAGHLSEAEQALSPEGLPGTSPSDARRVALSHAARSLALHPQSKEAAGLVSRLMLTPPDEAPPEVELETRALDGEEDVRTKRGGALVGLCLLAVMLSLLGWMGVRSWGGIALMLVPLGASVFLGIAKPFAAMRSLWPSLLGATCIAIAVAGTSRIGGSLWLPPVSAMLYASITMWNHGLGRGRIACIAIVLAGAIAPWLLEVCGVIESQYVFEDGGILVKPAMVALPPGRTELAFAMGQFVAIALTVAAFFRFSSADVDTRRRLQLVTWHLRGLAPNATNEPESSPSSVPLPAPERRGEFQRGSMEDTAPTVAD
jgi:serine/threonine-protein kinase